MWKSKKSDGPNDERQVEDKGTRIGRAIRHTEGCPYCAFSVTGLEQWAIDTVVVHIRSSHREID